MVRNKGWSGTGTIVERNRDILLEI